MSEERMKRFKILTSEILVDLEKLGNSLGNMKKDIVLLEPDSQVEACRIYGKIVGMLDGLSETIQPENLPSKEKEFSHNYIS